MHIDCESLPGGGPIFLLKFEKLYYQNSPCSFHKQSSLLIQRMRWADPNLTVTQIHPALLTSGSSRIQDTLNSSTYPSLPFATQQTMAESHLARKPECAWALIQYLTRIETLNFKFIQNSNLNCFKKESYDSNTLLQSRCPLKKGLCNC